MPLLKINIDGEYLEFQIIPINTKIHLTLLQRYSRNEMVDRAGFMSHVVKNPKMTKKDWEKLPSSTLTKIMNVISAYCENIHFRHKEIRELKVYISILENEIDEMYEYIEYNSDNWVWDTIKRKQHQLKGFEETLEQKENSLKNLKENKVLFEENKEVDYDVQSL